jgi:hypothetical protein
VIARRFAWLLALCVGCTGFHDAILSYDESDAGHASEQLDAAQALPENALDDAAFEPLAPLDAGPASDAAPVVAADTGVADSGEAQDTSTTADARTEPTCCELRQAWEDLLSHTDSGLLEPHLPCFEFSCQKPPPLPVFP